MRCEERWRVRALVNVRGIADECLAIRKAKYRREEGVREEGSTEVWKDG